MTVEHTRGVLQTCLSLVVCQGLHGTLGGYYMELLSSFQILLHRDTNEISIMKKCRYNSILCKQIITSVLCLELYHLRIACFEFGLHDLIEKRILHGAQKKAWDVIHPSSFWYLTYSAQLGFEQTFSVGSFFLFEQRGV